MHLVVDYFAILSIENMMIAPRMVLVVVAAVVVKAQNDIDVFKNEADLKVI